MQNNSSAPATDCDDSNPLVNPELPEVVDGVDNDCDGAIDEDTTAFDDDGDCYCEIQPVARASTAFVSPNGAQGTTSTTLGCP
ncbi:MAG: putative metal-binding motif-containing protein [Myxococcota bacterium]